MDVSIVAAIGSFVMNERLIKPKALVMVGLALLLLHDLATHSNDAASLRIYRGPGFLAFALFCAALSLRLWRRNGIACDELLFLPGTPLEDEHQRHGTWKEELWNFFGWEYRPNSSNGTRIGRRWYQRTSQNDEDADVRASGDNEDNNNNPVDGDSSKDYQVGGESSTEYKARSAATTTTTTTMGTSQLLEHQHHHHPTHDNEMVDINLTSSSAEIGVGQNNEANGNSTSSSSSSREGPTTQEQLMANFLSIWGLSFLPYFQRVRQSQLNIQEQAERSAIVRANAQNQQHLESVFNDSGDQEDTNTTTTSSLDRHESRNNTTEGAGAADTSNNETSESTTLNWAYSPSGAAVTGAALDLILPVLLNFHLFIAAYNHPKYAEADTPKIFPLIFFTVLNIRAQVPPGKRQRFWSSLQYTTLSPIFSVKFRDEIIGDVMTSLTRPLQDIAFAYVYYIAVIFHHEDIGEAAKLCNDSWLLQLWILPGVAILPLWWRFLQCLRQARDYRCRWPYYGNAFKYLTATLIVLYDIAHGMPARSNANSSAWASSTTSDDAIGSANVTDRTIMQYHNSTYNSMDRGPVNEDIQLEEEEEVYKRYWWIMCFLLATLYQIWWDTFIDWELFVLDTSTVENEEQELSEEDTTTTNYNVDNPNFIFNNPMATSASSSYDETDLNYESGANTSNKVVENRSPRKRTSDTLSPDDIDEHKQQNNFKSMRLHKQSSGRGKKRPVRWTLANISKLSFKLRARRMYRSDRLYYCIFWINCCFRFLWMLSFIPAKHISATDIHYLFSFNTHNSETHFVNSYSADMQSYFGPIIACSEIIRRCLWGILRVELESIKLYGHLHQHHHLRSDELHNTQKMTKNKVSDTDETIVELKAVGDNENDNNIELKPLVSVVAPEDDFSKSHIINLPIDSNSSSFDDGDIDNDLDENDVSPLMSSMKDSLTNRSRHNSEVVSSTASLSTSSNPAVAFSRRAAAQLRNKMHYCSSKNNEEWQDWIQSKMKLFVTMTCRCLHQISERTRNIELILWVVAFVWGGIHAVRA